MQIGFPLDRIEGGLTMLVRDFPIPRPDHAAGLDRTLPALHEPYVHWAWPEPAVPGRTRLTAEQWDQIRAAASR